MTTRMLRQQIKSWLTRDRVRISPDVGLELRLEIGQRVIMGDSVWVVVDRQPIDVGGNLGVHYHFTEPERNDPGILLNAEPFLLEPNETWCVSADARNSQMVCFL